eukprot:jgi/Psemu1/14081/gm1.14081_g
MVMRLYQILNVDKTTITLDGTSTNAGGRPVTEYGLSNRSLPCGCRREQKSSWRCTAVAGSTAAGDPIPLHFQLKSNSTEDKKRISKSFTDKLDKSGTCSGVWSIPGATVELLTMMPHTVNWNSAAGMDSAEFYAQPAKGKYYVCFIVDSGPGRSDPGLHWLMSKKKFVLIAVIPNTTHVTQVTVTVKTCDIPAQIFGYKESATLQLQSAFEEGFLGPAEIVRCLGDRNVAHEMMTLADRTIDVDADPTTIALLELECRNQIVVKMLTDSGFNGRVYSKLAPHIMLKNTLAKTQQPNTRAHYDTLQKSSSAGPRYDVLQGVLAYNCKDQHIVNERIVCPESNKVMKEETKTKALAYTQKREAAQPLIDNCDGGFIDLPVSELKKAFEWKLQEMSTRLNKDDIVVGALMEAEKDPPVGVGLN